MPHPGSLFKHGNIGFGSSKVGLSHLHDKMSRYAYVTDGSYKKKSSGYKHPTIDYDHDDDSSRKHHKISLKGGVPHLSAKGHSSKLSGKDWSPHDDGVSLGKSFKKGFGSRPRPVRESRDDPLDDLSYSYAGVDGLDSHVGYSGDHYGGHGGY